MDGLIVFARWRQIAPPFNTMPHWAHPSTLLSVPNDISIGSVVFAGLMAVRDRQTDRPRYSVYNNKPHLRRYSHGTAMRPNKMHCQHK